MKLTNLECQKAKAADKPRKLSDGKGLYLEVMPNGSKYWRLKYRYLNREKRLALGVYPEVSLQDAREKTYNARKQLSNGEDPSEVRKTKRMEKEIELRNSFENTASRSSRFNFLC